MDRDETTQPLVAADLFLGLAGVLLVVLGLLSSGLRGLLQSPPANEAAIARLAATTPRPIAYAGATEALFLASGAPTLVLPRDSLPGAAEVRDWLGDHPGTPLLILAADSADTGFLLELALADSPAITRIRLPGACGSLRLTGDTLTCSLP